ncbi:hypothetical protein NKH69_31550 [Mesorhizobium sp. M0976]|uniref:hypothetical protein n=1 Tax=Mesorhizobium sp. M0976 TaxID=2957038 RepID=UPI00333ACE40
MRDVAAVRSFHCHLDILVDQLESQAVEIHENWLEATRYLNMDHLREHKKESLRALAA